MNKIETWGRRLTSYLERKRTQADAFDRRRPMIKFVAFASVAVLYVMFLGEYPIWDYIEINQRKRFLENEIEEYAPRLTTDSLRLVQIKNMGRQVEHVAREQYLMKSPGEEIYIIKAAPTKQD